MTCTARQYSDQMICETCGLQWDVNDSDPPPCKPDQTVEAARRKALQQIARLEL